MYHCSIGIAPSVPVGELVVRAEEVRRVAQRRHLAEAALRVLDVDGPIPATRPPPGSPAARSPSSQSSEPPLEAAHSGKNSGSFCRRR